MCKLQSTRCMYQYCAMSVRPTEESKIYLKTKDNPSLIIVSAEIKYSRYLFAGFLNANPVPHLKARVANYGLMDQIAALHWIQQNIALFGGDPGNVTLVGHGSGAACINFLMISPTVMPGLFHRTILLSGSALSSWALVEDPVNYAVKLAKEVNCTIPEDVAKDHEEIVDCLREMPLDELLQADADVTPPSYLSAFGPSVDGVVIKTDFAKELVTYFKPSDLQSFVGPVNANMKRSEATLTPRGSNTYDLLFGVVTSEALWRFSASDIQAGFEGERRDKIIRTYVRNAYTYHLSEIFFTVVNEYTDWERTVQHPINTRDAAVAALSDAQFVAPLVQTGDLLSAKPPQPGQEPTGPKTFFYVFDYQTKDGDYPQRMGTVHGEELPYFFGAPLVDGFNHFPRNYTRSELALAEAVIIYIANFARTGKDVQIKEDYVVRDQRSTLSLIEAYKDNRNDVGTFKIRNMKRLWEVIAEQLNKSLHTNITPNNAENRWRVLERNYKKCIDNNKQTGRGRKQFEYTKQLEEIFQGKKNVEPEILLSASTGAEPPVEELNIDKPTCSYSEPKKLPIPISKRKRIRSTTYDEARKENQKYKKDSLEFKKLYFEEKIELQKRKLKLMEERNDLLRQIIANQINVHVRINI
ncbi:Myb/SANT-like DNA-binding domain [Popillia japonica]|uniref:Myb/SANT-like DNA-binding domain n=1 Tax=Popillia japonica TaxID=7064 RepID=A0AAW1LUY7_POPJA